MGIAARVGVGAFAVALFIVTAFVVLQPVRYTDSGLGLAPVRGGTSLRRVVAVAAHSPASDAGLREGDLVDLAPLGPGDVSILRWGLAPHTIALPALRGARAFTASLRFYHPMLRLPLWARGITIVANLTCLVLVFVILRSAVHRREGRLLLGFAIGNLGDNVALQQFAPTGGWAVAGYLTVTLFVFILWAFLIRFVVSVPQRNSPHNRLLNAAVVPMIVLLAVTMLWRTSAWLWPATDLPLGSGSAAFRIFWICDLVTNCFIILAIVDGVVYSTQRQRIQMQWIGSTVVIALLIEMLRGLYFSVSGSSPEVLEMLAFPIESVMVLGAAYAVLKYRLIDFEFVFSRAAVFTGVSAVLVLVFLALEWIAANVGDQLLGLAKLDASVERYSGLFAALVAGLLARPVHAVVDRALNRIFFARQRRDEEELRRFAREAEVATDHAQLIDAAFEIARKHVDATFVAVFVREGHGYRCTHTTGDAPRPPLQENDPIVLRMRRFGDPFELEDGERDYHHCVFFPMTVLGRLVAFFVCGPKQDRTHYTEREMETFTVFAQRVGTAYAWLSETSAPKKPIAV